MRTYWGSDGKFRGWSSNFSPSFGGFWILALIIVALLLYVVPFICGIISLLLFIYRNRGEDNLKYALLFLMGGVITYFIWSYTIWN